MLPRHHWNVEVKLYEGVCVDSTDKCLSNSFDVATWIFKIETDVYSGNPERLRLVVCYPSKTELFLIRVVWNNIATGVPVWLVKNHKTPGRDFQYIFLTVLLAKLRETGAVLQYLLVVFIVVEAEVEPANVTLCIIEVHSLNTINQYMLLESGHYVDLHVLCACPFLDGPFDWGLQLLFLQSAVLSFNGSNETFLAELGCCLFLPVLFLFLQLLHVLTNTLNTYWLNGCLLSFFSISTIEYIINKCHSSRTKVA